MSQAIIDPEEVRRFAAELKRFNGDLRERSNSLLARFNALGDTWQDQEQEKFAGEFLQKSTPHICSARRTASSSTSTSAESCPTKSASPRSMHWKRSVRN